MQYSIVNYSKVKRTHAFRVDAEYWHPELIRNSRLVSDERKLVDILKNDVENIKSSPIDRNFSYLEISKISLSGGHYQTITIEPSNVPDRAHHILRKADVVVSTVRPNRNAVALIENDGVIGSSGLCVLRTTQIEPEYLFIFCKTEYFIKCLIRADKASMYPAVSSNDIISTPFFMPSDNFRSLVVEVVKAAFSQINQSKQLYSSTEKLLLSELQLTDWQPKHQLTFTKNYSDTRDAERIDADYFQPKYKEIINVIEKYKGRCAVLENACSIKNKNFIPTDRQKYKYIELSNIIGNGEISDCMTEYGQDLPTRARRKVSTGDVIVSSIEGSLSSIALITEEYNQALCSTGFHVINSKILNSETLLVFLKSIAGQLQLKKGCSGTILTAINDEEFKKLTLPIISEKTQTKIRSVVTKSFALRKESKRLLESAKRAVEIAIEKNEKEATKWLKAETEKIKP